MLQFCVVAGLYAGNVHDGYIVSVDVDALVSNNQLLEPLAVLVLMSEHVESGVPNIKFVLPLGQENVFLGVLSIYSDDEESKLLLKFVSKDVEVVLFLIILNFFDGSDAEELV